MKKRFTAFLTAFLCMSAAITALPAGAQDAEALDEVYTIATDTFVYTNYSYFGNRDGFFLETELVDPDLMVIGMKYYEKNSETWCNYWVTPINDANAEYGFGIIQHAVAIEQFGDQQLRVGDLIQFNGQHGCADIYPTYYVPLDDGSFTLLGNGVDIFGEEFERVIRLQLVIEQTEYENNKYAIYDIDLMQGDVNVDDEMNILDCICISQALMGYGALCDYGRVAGDVNEDNTLDSGDTLMILRELLKLTENFE